MSNKQKGQMLTPEELCRLYPEQMEELQKADAALYKKLMQTPVRKEVWEAFFTMRLPFPKETGRCLELLLQHPEKFDEEWFRLLYEMGAGTDTVSFLDVLLSYVKQEIYAEAGEKGLTAADILEVFHASQGDVVLFQKLLEECRIRKEREVWDRENQEEILEENTVEKDTKRLHETIGVQEDGLLEELDQLILKMTELRSIAYAEALEHRRCREEKEKLKANYRKLQEAYKETYARCNRLQEFLKEQAEFHGELMEENV